MREQPAPGEIKGAQGRAPSQREGLEGEIVDTGTEREVEVQDGRIAPRGSGEKVKATWLESGAVR